MYINICIYIYIYIYTYTCTCINNKQAISNDENKLPLEELATEAELKRFAADRGGYFPAPQFTPTAYNMLCYAMLCYSIP